MCWFTPIPPANTRKTRSATKANIFPPRVTVIDGRRTSKAIRTMLKRITATRVVVFPVIGFSPIMRRGRWFVSLPVFVADETRTTGRRRSVLNHVLLIRQFAAVGEQLLQFLFAQRLFVSLHLSFALQQHLHRLGVRHLLELFRAEVADLQFFSFGSVGASVIPVADSAFRGVDALRALNSKGRRR